MKNKTLQLTSLIVLAVVFFGAAGMTAKAGPLYKNLFNPARETLSITFTSNSIGLAEVNIYNIKGQLVRKFSSAITGAGVQTAVWDGKNDKGTVVASGIYLVNIKKDKEFILMAEKVAAIK